MKKYTGVVEIKGAIMSRGRRKEKMEVRGKGIEYEYENENGVGDEEEGMKCIRTCNYQIQWEYILQGKHW